MVLFLRRLNPSILYCNLLAFGKLGMLIGSEVYSTVSYFRKTDPLAIVTTGACTVVTKINDLQIDLE